jgi:adenylylsulfate kinase-like enzyme
MQLYTWKEFRSGAIRRMEFTQKELAEIGLALLVRLVSLERHARRSKRKIRKNRKLDV